ncbi:rhamnogalacturonan acetylesterase [Flavobacterium sp. WC2509]|uniref:rhamnogalacturonan acetylesterase n=1 Tax=Flavobacterium sp. WC2509 TaxID=3461406 RepID=UPI004043AF15
MNKIKRILVLLVVATIIFSFSSPKQTNIWLIGDSTMAAKKPERLPESGWGVALANFVTDKAVVHNHAASGRSTLSFITEGRWKTVSDSLQKGDYVVIQFGHNDEKTEEKLHTEPFGTFKNNMQKFIEESRKKGAIPIVCSSIVRRHFDGKGNLIDTHGDYIKAAQEIAKETKTPYIDMEAATRKLVTEMGPEKSKEIYNFARSKKDSTHVNVKGAEMVAQLFVTEVKTKSLPLAKLFK